MQSDGSVRPRPYLTQLLTDVCFLPNPRRPTDQICRTAKCWPSLRTINTCLITLDQKSLIRSGMNPTRSSRYIEGWKSQSAGRIVTNYLFAFLRLCAATIFATVA